MCMYVSEFVFSALLLFVCRFFFLQHHHLPSSCVFCCLCTVLKLYTYRFALRWNIIRFIYRFWSFTLHWDFCSISLFNFGSQNTSIKPNCLVQSCYGWRVCFIYFWLWCCFFDTNTDTRTFTYTDKALAFAFAYAIINWSIRLIPFRSIRCLFYSFHP